MDNLPKRDDKIYEEVENFADYELTQCVAFEMAIRNDEVIKLVNKLTNNFNNSDYEELISFGLDYHILADYGYLDKYYFLNNQKKEEKRQAKKIDVSKSSEFSFFNKDAKTSITVKNKIEFTQEIVKGEYSGVENINYYEVYKSEATIHYSRPKLNIGNIKTMNIAFDMHLPKKELEAQFKHILTTYYKDKKIIKTSLDLFDEFAEDSSGKLSNKSLADKFFVYDYIKTQLNNILLDNNKLKEANNKDIEIVKNNMYITGSDKKIQIDALKGELKGNLNETTLTNILEDKETLNATKLNKASIKRYYFIIKPYIEKTEYKELLTNIKN